MTASDLKNWRISLGLSQRKAAAELGVTLLTYQSWERGEWYGSHRVAVITPAIAALCEKITREAATPRACGNG